MTWQGIIKEDSFVSKKNKFIKYIRDTYKALDKEPSDYTEKSLVKLKGMADPSEPYNKILTISGRLNATTHFDSTKFNSFFKELNIKKPEGK